VKAPTSNGPIIEDMPKMDPIIPTNAGSFPNGTTATRRMTDPENIPALPIPARARPIINAFEFGAAPHTTEPTSKRAIAER
jgi:hypothetical protein